MVKRPTDLTFSGRTLVSGLGQGRTFVYRDDLKRLDEFYDIQALEVKDELKRFEQAVSQISGDLSDLAGEVGKEMDTSFSDVFHAHIAMVEDISLKTEVMQEIRETLVSAGSAVRTVFRRWENRFRSMEAEVAGQKADDMHDLARRLLFSLAGVRAHVLEDLPPGSVLVANRLLPTDTVFLARRGAAAAVLEVGGPASHAALFAHEIGLPCVAGLVSVVDRIPPNELALVDADTGEVIINPDQKQEQAFKAKRELREQASSKARARAHAQAVTKNGKVISVLANVERVEDTLEAMANGADGIGLYRIESVYLGCQEPPDASTLHREMYTTLRPAKGLPVYVRLLDVGADKPLPFLEAHRESNPALGRRGIRFLLKYPELLQTQLQALLQLSSDFDLHILVPMVTLPSDIRAVKQRLVEMARRTETSRVPELGAMIETPAAALAAPEIVKYAKFLSFGTNDLTQYTFVADRENAAVDAYFDDTHEVIFRLLKIAHEDVPDIPLSICGELAGRPRAISEILKRGIGSLSVAPLSIPMIKEAVRRCEVR
jgi:phosphoenolpyruvate-protein phosphotransferase